MAALLVNIDVDGLERAIAFYSRSAHGFGLIEFLGRGYDGIATKP